MRNREKVTIDNAKIGMKIKVVLPRTWCQVNHTSPYVWMKGTIIDVNYSKADPTKISGLTFNCKWKKQRYWFKTNRMWTPVDKETGIFKQVYKCK